MSRLAVGFTCLLIVAGFSGCCSCGCQQASQYGGGYAMDGGGYSMDGSYSSNQGGCGCNGGGTSGGTNGSSAYYGDMGQAYGEMTQPMPADSSYVTNPNIPTSAPQYSNFNNMPVSTQPMQTQASRTMPQNPYSGNIQQAGYSTWDVSPAAAQALPPQSYPRRAPCNCGR